MSDLNRSIGAFAGKVASKDGVVSGMLDALDASVVARAVGENQAFLEQLIANLDARTLAGAINGNPQFLASLVRELDAGVVGNAVNKNQRFVLKLVDSLHPNLFTRLSNVLFDKVRYATSNPGLGEVDDKTRELCS